MRNEYRIMREGIYTNPHILTSLSPKLKSIANKYLLSDTGMEFETQYDDNILTLIDKAKELKIVDINMGCYEQRFRITTGIEGLIQLYDVCEFMKTNCQLNMASGIHYHIDLTDVWDLTANRKNVICRRNNDWILKALKSWGYKGTYNQWEVSTNKTAVRLHNYYKTLEIRIGEMSFEYELLVKRIIHCQNIVRRLKDSLKKTYGKVETAKSNKRKDKGRTSSFNYDLA